MDFINGQKRAAYADIPYGRSTVGRAGCEAIACYNAMILLGRPLPFGEVKAYFEKLFRRGLGWGFGGILGASPIEIRLFLRKNRVYFHAVRSIKHFKRMPASPGVLIVSYWNKPLLKYGFHTVAIDCRVPESGGEPQLTVYNRFNHSEGPETITGLSELMEGSRRFIRGFFIPY